MRVDRRWNAVLLIGALARGTALATDAAAETKVDGAVLSGEVEAGGKFLSGSWGSAQFNQYQDQRPGFFGQSHFLLEDAERRNYFGFDYDYVGSNDQTYEARFGRWGTWSLDLEFMEYPFNYSNTAQTLYLQSNSEYLLPGGLQARIQAAPTTAGKSAILQNALESAPGVGLSTMYRQGQAEARYMLPGDIEFHGGFGMQHRDGTMPLGIGFGSPGGNFANFAAQVDDWTYTANAGIGLIRDSWNLAFNYDGSFYINDVGELTVANPLRATNSPAAGSAFGRLSGAPSNEANTFSLTGGWKLPIEIPTRITGTFSYGQRTQDDPFLPQTINPAIIAANPAAVVLPKQSLGGLVDTYLANLVATSRLTQALDLRFQYRYYDFQNRTPSITFPVSEVVNDDEFTPGQRSSVATGYRRQNTSLDLTYQLAPPLSMTFGYEWQQMKRSSDREQIYADTNTGRISANLRPNERVQIRAAYQLSRQAGDNYSPFAPLNATFPPADAAASAPLGQLPQLRKYDEAHFWKNEASLISQFMLCENLDATLSAGFSDSNYDTSTYGLKDWKDWNAGTDLAYHPLEWLSLTTGYEYQYTHADQNNRLRNPDPTGTFAIDTPLNDWSSSWHSRMQNVHAGVDVTVIPKLVDVHFAYGIQLSRDRTNTYGVTGGPFLVGLNYPTDNNTLQFFTTRIDYHLTEMLTLRAAWRWERFDINDFRRNSAFLPFNASSNVNTMTGAISPSTNVFLGDRVQDYNVHIVGFSAIVKF